MSPTHVQQFKMSQWGIPFYPVLIVLADIGLAGVLILFAPVLSVLLTTAALSVVVAVVVRARGYAPLSPRSEVSCDG